MRLGAVNRGLAWEGREGNEKATEHRTFNIEHPTLNVQMGNWEDGTRTDVGFGPVFERLQWATIGVVWVLATENAKSAEQCEDEDESHGRTPPFRASGRQGPRKHWVK